MSRYLSQVVSLCDVCWFQGNLVTWPEVLRIACSMVQGLAFLHEDLPATKLDGHKPSIAHRDFKSRNVLIRSDMTACVADFGLALIFEPSKNVGYTHGQVSDVYFSPSLFTHLCPHQPSPVPHNHLAHSPPHSPCCPYLLFPPTLRVSAFFLQLVFDKQFIFPDVLPLHLFSSGDVYKTL